MVSALYVFCFEIHRIDRFQPKLAAERRLAMSDAVNIKEEQQKTKGIWARQVLVGQVVGSKTSYGFDIKQVFLLL